MKFTFASRTFKAWTFRCDTWRGGLMDFPVGKTVTKVGPVGKAVSLPTRRR